MGPKMLLVIIDKPQCLRKRGNESYQLVLVLTSELGKSGEDVGLADGMTGEVEELPLDLVLNAVV